MDAGVLWIVAGVWTARAVSGVSMGLAWGFACFAVALRWGTLSLGDVEVATRLTGPTLLSGTTPVRIAMAAAFVGAVMDEARIDGLRDPSRAGQAAAVTALVGLAGLFFTGGPQAPFTEALGGWAAAAAIVGAVVLLTAKLTRRMPAWVPVVVALAGLVGASLST